MDTHNAQKSLPVPIKKPSLPKADRTPPHGSLDVHALHDGPEASSSSVALLSRSSPLHCPHGRIVYLDTIIIELLGGARIASKPYSAASGHHIMLMQGERMWKVTRSKRESRFYVAIAEGASGEAAPLSPGSTPPVPRPMADSIRSLNDEVAKRRAAMLLEPFVPHSYGIRKVRRLRVGSYELGEEVILSKEDLQRLVEATQALHAMSDGTDSNDGSHAGSPVMASRPTTPLVAVATFSPTSEHVAGDFQSATRRDQDGTLSRSDSTHPHPHDHAQACHTCPLIAERPEVLQSIVQQFDRDMEDVWLRYYRYVPPALPPPDASPPMGVYHSVSSPTRSAPAADDATSSTKATAAASPPPDAAELPGTPSPTPLAFSFVLSGSAGPPATEPHVAMEDQLNCQLPASGPPEQSYVEMIVLEDCCHGLQYPCTMDIKMGTRQYGLNASEEKMRSKNKKAKLSTTGTYGIRIDGVRRWNMATKICETEDKKYFRRFNIDEVREAIYAFLTPYDATLAAAMRAKMRVQCEALLHAFETQTVYHFYTSSLLFLYDANRPVESCRIVMVDFAYTYQTCELVEAEGESALPEGGHDVSYMTGLRSLISLLQDTPEETQVNATSS